MLARLTWLIPGRVEVGAAPYKHTGSRMGEGQAPRNRMDSDMRRKDAG